MDAGWEGWGGARDAVVGLREEFGHAVFVHDARCGNAKGPFGAVVERGPAHLGHTTFEAARFHHAGALREPDGLAAQRVEEVDECECGGEKEHGFAGGRGRTHAPDIHAALRVEGPHRAGDVAFRGNEPRHGGERRIRDHAGTGDERQHPQAPGTAHEVAAIVGVRGRPVQREAEDVMFTPTSAPSRRAAGAKDHLGRAGHDRGVPEGSHGDWRDSVPGRGRSPGRGVPESAQDGIGRPLGGVDAHREVVECGIVREGGCRYEVWGAGNPAGHGILVATARPPGTL